MQQKLHIWSVSWAKQAFDSLLTIFEEYVKVKLYYLLTLKPKCHLNSGMTRKREAVYLNYTSHILYT